MKKSLRFVFLLLIPSLIFAQMSVVSTVPANNAKNVPLITTISITFSEAIDTVALKVNGDNTSYANIDSVSSSGYSADQKTMYANVVLKPNSSYFIAFIYMKAKSGAILSSPVVYYFTTGADFAPYSVSGTVLSGSTGISPEGSIVGLANVNIMKDEGKNGPPPFAGWANVNSNGTYSVPNMSNGTYWPIAVKDVDHDGNLDPDKGVDVVAFADSIVINNGSKTNFNLTFMSFSPKTFSETITIADSLAKNLIADKVLRRISGWEVDTLGKSRSWEFAYTVNNNSSGQSISIQSSGSKTNILDQGYVDWLKQLKPITNYSTVASSATVIANAEIAGGKTFRRLPIPDTLTFRIELSIADQKYGWFGPFGFDTSKVYWAAAYTQQYQMSSNQSTWVKGKFFLCDLATGTVLLTQTMGVKQDQTIPVQFVLHQNYPNPFNPTTNISFTIPASNVTSLRIFDILGKEVAVLLNGKMDAGDYDIPFNASHLTSGIYFYQLRSGNFVETKKMVLMR
jgi:methionine-rich copper-binding protein CopC